MLYQIYDFHIKSNITIFNIKNRIPHMKSYITDVSMHFFL